MLFRSHLLFLFPSHDTSSTTICNVTFNGTGEQTLSGTTPVLTRFRGITLSKSTKDDKVKSTIDTQFGGSGLLLLTKGTWEQYAGNLINLSGNQTLGSADGVLLIDGTGGFTNYNGTTYTSASLAVSTGTFTVNTSGTVQIGTGANSVTCTTPGIINLTSGTVLINGRLTITTLHSDMPSKPWRHCPTIKKVSVGLCGWPKPILSTRIIRLPQNI